MNPEKPEYELIIRPKKGWVSLDIKELWKYSELIFFFVWRDIKIRYKQTVIGILWVIFQPLITMVIFSIFFGRLARIPSDNIPYPIFVFIGLIFWNYFSSGLSRTGESMVANANVIRKIYFPRLVIPISSSLTGLVDFAVSSTILLVLMVYYRYIPSLAGIVFIPLLILVSFLTSVGLGSLIASINVKYRDVRHIMPFFIQVLLFLTPVIYPVSIANERFKYLFAINPMAGVIQTARVLVLNTGQADWPFLSLSILSAVVFFVIGIMYFRKTERFFADYI